MNDSTATLISEATVSPGGANVPTYRKEYYCPCGKGKIVEECVPGFDDWYATIECPTCREKYIVLTGCGHIWELKERI